MDDAAALQALLETRAFTETVKWLRILTKQPDRDFDAMTLEEIAAAVREAHFAVVWGTQLAVLYCALASLKEVDWTEFCKALALENVPQDKREGLEYWSQRRLLGLTNVQDWMYESKKFYRPMLARGHYRPWVPRNLLRHIQQMMDRLGGEFEEAFDWGVFFDGLLTIGAPWSMVRDITRTLRWLFGDARSKLPDDFREHALRYLSERSPLIAQAMPNLAEILNAPQTGADTDAAF